MVPVEAQFFSLLAMILLGIIMGTVFDIYRELRNTFKLKTVATNLWDLLVWIILVVIAFAMLLLTNNGEVRLITFIEIAIGLILYFSLLSKTNRKVVRVVLYIVFRVIAAIWFVIRIPVSFLQKILTIPANLISLVLLKTTVPITRKCKALASCLKRKKEQ